MLCMVLPFRDLAGPKSAKIPTLQPNYLQIQAKRLTTPDCCWGLSFMIRSLLWLGTVNLKSSQRAIRGIQRAQERHSNDRTAFVDFGLPKFRPGSGYIHNDSPWQALPASYGIATLNSRAVCQDTKPYVVTLAPNNLR